MKAAVKRVDNTNEIQRLERKRAKLIKSLETFQSQTADNAYFSRVPKEIQERNKVVMGQLEKEINDITNSIEMLQKE
jgi:valyl-tRNA synthetase